MIMGLDQLANLDIFIEIRFNKACLILTGFANNKNET